MMFKGLTSSRKVADKKPSSRSGNEGDWLLLLKLPLRREKRVREILRPSWG